MILLIICPYNYVKHIQGIQIKTNVNEAIPKIFISAMTDRFKSLQTINDQHLPQQISKPHDKQSCLT